MDSDLHNQGAAYRRMPTGPSGVYRLECITHKGQRHEITQYHFALHCLLSPSVVFSDAYASQ